MKTSTSVIPAVFLSILLGCPVGPKSEEEEDDGASDVTGSSDPATAGSSTSSPPPSEPKPADPESAACEEELSLVKKALAECQAQQ